MKVRKPSRKTASAKKAKPRKPSAAKAARKPARAAAKRPAARAAGAVRLSPGAENPQGAGARDSAAGKYVYCIIQASGPLRFGAIGIGVEPSDVHTVNYRDIAAVVSDTPLEVYDPTRENVLAHERVNDAVMREHTVIPMSFGTVFKTSKDIVELLRSAYDAFRDVLGKMRDKVEFGLKVLWEPDAVIRELEAQDENLSRLRQEISSQRGSTYFARMQYGRLVDSLLQNRSELLVAEIFSALRDVAIASRVNKPIGDKMILNAAFLVDRRREAEFDAEVKAIGQRHENLNIRYTGPWPPYNFVNIRLKLERSTGG
jgi:gas vesicle protein GvpL/GvpF